MPFSKSFKLVGGTVGLSMTLGVPAAIASQEASGNDDIVLDDVVAVTDIGSTMFSLHGPFVLSANDSLASPFDSVDSVASVASVDSPDSPDSVDSVDTVATVDCVDSVDSVESVDSPDSSDSA